MWVNQRADPGPAPVTNKPDLDPIPREGVSYLVELGHYTVIAHGTSALDPREIPIEHPIVPHNWGYSPLQLGSKSPFPSRSPRLPRLIPVLWLRTPKVCCIELHRWRGKGRKYVLDRAGIRPWLSFVATLLYG